MITGVKTALYGLILLSTKGENAMNTKEPYMIIDLENEIIKLLDSRETFPLRNYFRYFEIIRCRCIFYTKSHHSYLYRANIIGVSVVGEKIIVDKPAPIRKLSIEEMI